MPEWEPFFAPLVDAGRAATLLVGGQRVLDAGRALSDLRAAVHPEAVLEPPIEGLLPPRGIPETEEGCAAEILRGWFESGGP